MIKPDIPHAITAYAADQLETVCIVGLGYVGLTLAVAMAEAGYSVYGVEKSASICEAVNAGRAHFSEVGLDPLVAKHVANGKLKCAATLPPAGEASIYIVTVGTPLTKEGAANLAAIENVLDAIAGNLQDGDLVLLRSTVKTGTTRSIVKPILDATGRDYDLAFCPERTLEGKALLELTSLPQIVGADSQRARERAQAIFSVFAPKVIILNSFEAAELVKLINNTHRDLMFAFANEVAELCDAIGVSAIDVITASCMDYPRSKIASPGLVGGPCLEKDPHILAEGLREVQYTPRIALAGRRMNEELPRSSIANIAKSMQKIGLADIGHGKITLLGLAFKGEPATDDLRGSMAERVLEVARARWPQAQYCAYDPIVTNEKFSHFGVCPCNSLQEAFTDTSLVLILNNHSVFATMDLRALAASMNEPGLVYDYWNLFNAASLDMAGERHYAGLGTLAALQAPRSYSDKIIAAY